MENFTINDLSNNSEKTSNNALEQPSNESLAFILAYSSSLEIEESKLLNQAVKINLN